MTWEFFKVHTTNKLIKFRSGWIRFIFLVCIVLITILIGVYITAYEDAMLKSDRIESAVTFKVYGTLKTNFSREEFKDRVNVSHTIYNRVWDAKDYVDIQQSEVFIMTNVIIQSGQKYSTCAEDPEVENAICEPNKANSCSLLGGFNGKGGNGIPTGNCIQNNFTNYTKVHTCEIVAWCPIMYRDELPLKNDTSLLRATEDSIVIISNSVNFPEFNFPARNVENFRRCDWKDPSCPIRPLGYLIREAHMNKNYDDVFKYGAVLKVEIRWECYLNTLGDMFIFWRSDYKPCRPTYVVKDFPNPDYHSWHSRNFVYKESFNDEKNERKLIKAFGIRIIVMVSGIAKKYDLFVWIAKFIALVGALNLFIWFFSFVLLSYCRKPKPKIVFEPLVKVGPPDETEPLFEAELKYKFEPYAEVVGDSYDVVCWRVFWCKNKLTSMCQKTKQRIFNYNHIEMENMNVQEVVHT